MLDCCVFSVVDHTQLCSETTGCFEPRWARSVGTIKHIFFQFVFSLITEIKEHMTYLQHRDAGPI